MRRRRIAARPTKLQAHERQRGGLRNGRREELVAVDLEYYGAVEDATTFWLTRRSCPSRGCDPELKGCNCVRSVKCRVEICSGVRVNVRIGDIGVEKEVARTRKESTRG